MSSLTGRRRSDVKEATDELAELKEQTETARAELARVQDAVEEQERLLGIDTAHLVEVNQKLAASNERALDAAKDCVDRLKDVSNFADFDFLTLLPNRALLLDRLSTAIAQAKRNDKKLAVMFLDLDDFKRINDTLGHAAGDETLTRVARALETAVRGGDTVARYGGDEFVILLIDVLSARDAVKIATKVIAALDTQVDDRQPPVGASVGISIYPDDGEDPGALIDRADKAMYAAKKNNLGAQLFDGREAPPGASAL